MRRYNPFSAWQAGILEIMRIGVHLPVFGPIVYDYTLHHVCPQAKSADFKKGAEETLAVFVNSSISTC